jgi:hypothetical protein
MSHAAAADCTQRESFCASAPTDIYIIGPDTSLTWRRKEEKNLLNWPGFGGKERRRRRTHVQYITLLAASKSDQIGN